MRSAIKYFFTILIFVASCYLSFAQKINTLTIGETKTANSFPIVTTASIVPFHIDSNDAKVVTIAANAFANDMQMISGKKMSLLNSAPSNNFSIIAGTIGKSKLIDDLIITKQIDVTAIKNKWECFIIKVSGKKLIIAGSDRRGTAFGIFHLSRLMGVSPFVWWADVTPVKKKELFISGSYTSTTPSVQYRGIFINDEDWGLQPWAAKHMDTVIKDIGPKTYAKVFELLLRLKSNYIWPAMHPCTKAFYYYKENPKVADDYAIVVGGSHCEPMLRNNVFEWAENYEHEYGKKPGEWRYDLNKGEIYKYWDDRIKEAANYESVYTVGMRGVHDGSMPGPKDPNEKLKLLENVVADQRTILTTNLNKNAAAIPQIFVPYKEVLSLYRRGMKLEDDVTIIWPDDNHGYIRQLPNEKERNRSGGNGVYYHLSYWGAPQDYLWLSSISPSLIAYEMNKAYQYGAKKLWVFNVGDIKPAELEMQFAMDMAWDISKAAPAKAYDYTKDWAAETFGKKLSNSIAAIKNEYYLLAASGKPEHMNSVSLSNDNFYQRNTKYSKLFEEVAALEVNIPMEKRDAYFQLISYPIMSAALMSNKFYFARMSFLSLAGNSRNNATLARKSFESIKNITELYNTGISNRKWDGMMDWKPRNQEVFNVPLTSDSASPAQKDSLKILYAKILTPQLIIEAAAFNTKKEFGATAIQLLPGVGIVKKGVTATNKRMIPYAPINSAYIEFDLPNLETGSYTIIVKCLPTFDVGNSKNLRYSISLNGETPKTINVHVEADSKEWKENVIRGYSTGKSIHTIKKDKNKLRFYFKDYNLVVSTIEFYKN